MNPGKELVAGVIGLGRIGGGVATSLANRGRKTHVFNRTPGKYRQHPGCPPEEESAKAVGEKSDIIMLAPFDYAQCEEILLGSEGLLAGSHEGMVVVMLSTISVDQCRHLADLCAQKGVGFLDCGVTPGSKAAENGLVAMIGGDPDVFDYARPVLEDWSCAPILCGPVGCGMIVKVARNANTFCFWRVITETARLCKAAGVDLSKYLEVCQTADRVDDLFYNILKQRASSPDGKLPERAREMYPPYMSKDLHASDDLARELGVQTPVRDLVIELIRDTCDLPESL